MVSPTDPTHRPALTTNSRAKHPGREMHGRFDKLVGFGYAEIARIDGISEEEARLRYRHVELNGPDNGNGIQITLYDDNASITIPYWHQPEAARVVFDEVWRYLRALHESGGFFVYDPQLDRVIDLDADPRDMINEYGRVVANIPDIIEQGKSQSKRAWWKLW